MTVAKLCGEQRQLLRRAIDARRRELVDTSDCGGSASKFTYKQGCRCASCRALIAAYKRRYRDANRAVNAAHRSAYKQRRRLLTASRASARGHASHRKEVT